MASIKLKHSGGNGTILNSPAANPSSDVTLKLPSTTGSAGQVLKVASANHSSTNAELEFAAGGGITEADSWRLNTDTSFGTGTNSITANWERDDTNFEVIGTGLSHDGSGKFGFQVTGKYLLTFFYTGAILSGNDSFYTGIRIYLATDGISGTYSEIAQSLDSVKGMSSSSTYAAGSTQKILDVTNTSTYFYLAAYCTGSVTWRLDGSSTRNQNGFTSIRLGDT